MFPNVDDEVLNIAANHDDAESVFHINAGFLKEVSSTSSGDTASRRILNTTNIIDPSYQLRCTAYMLRNKDKSVKCQLLLPTKHKLYVSGRGTIHTNCTGNCMTARRGAGNTFHEV
ncbi:hypothetical protein DPMN_081634, partial [Dreissena polymorpha]